MLKLFLRKEPSSVTGTEDTEKSSGAGCDSADTSCSRFDWAQESLFKNYLTLGADTPRSEQTPPVSAKPGSFFVNATPVQDEEFVDPFTSSFEGVLQARREKNKEKKDKQQQPDTEQESQQDVEAKEDAGGEDWMTVKPRQPRSSRTRTRTGEGIAGLTGGDRKRMTSQQRIQKALAAASPAGFNAHLARMKRSASNLTRDSSSKRSKERTPPKK